MRALKHAISCQIMLPILGDHPGCEADVIEISGRPYAILEHKESALQIVPIEFEKITHWPIEDYQDLTTGAYREHVDPANSFEIPGSADWRGRQKPTFYINRFNEHPPIVLDEDEPTPGDIAASRAGKIRIQRLCDETVLNLRGEWEPIAMRDRLSPDRLTEIASGILFPTSAEPDEQVHVHYLEARARSTEVPAFA